MAMRGGGSIVALREAQKLERSGRLSTFRRKRTTPPGRTLSRIPLVAGVRAPPSMPMKRICPRWRDSPERASLGMWPILSEAAGRFNRL
jgi:hypothetical protein